MNVNELIVKCKCGQVLDHDDPLGLGVVTVEPCPNCLMLMEQEAIAKGADMALEAQRKLKQKYIHAELDRA